MAGMSQSTLARALGLSFQQVQKYESGANRISASKLYDAANLLGVSIATLYEGLDTGPTGYDAQDLTVTVADADVLQAARLLNAASPTLRAQALAMVRILVRKTDEREVAPQGVAAE